MFRSAHVAGAALAALLAATSGAAALAAPAPFSFRSVEFLPADQRVPAADAFVRREVVQGMPLAQAVAAMRAAGAYCRTRADGWTRCTHASFERHSGHDLTDVTWRIDIAAPGGAVSDAVVHRVVSG